MLDFVRIIFYIQQFLDSVIGYFKKEVQEKQKRKKHYEPPTAPDKYKRMLTYHNEFRHEYNLPPVQLHNKLSIAALIHAENVDKHGNTTHVDFDKRVQLGVVGEIVINSKENPLATFQKVIQNKNRRSTILSDVEYVGFGEKNGYWVLLFAKVVL